jgi:chromosome segregation ATPase
VVEVAHLDAALFEQRRLAHMLRQRGAEIEALHADRERLAIKQSAARERESELGEELRGLEEAIASATSDRERLEAELGRARYDADLRAERIEAELVTAGEEQERLEAELVTAGKEQERLAAELEGAGYEARRAERRLSRVERDAAAANRRIRLKVDALAAELQESQIAREAALEEHRRALRARDDAARAAQDSVRELEKTARGLGSARRDVELLIEQEREREVLLAGSDCALTEVGEHLLRVRASRSWRWGHALAQGLRAVTLRRRSSRSSLDTALGRLEAEGRFQADAG